MSSWQRGKNSLRQEQVTALIRGRRLKEGGAYKILKNFRGRLKEGGAK